jgi:hypothetical protein
LLSSNKEDEMIRKAASLILATTLASGAYGDEAPFEGLRPHRGSDLRIDGSIDIPRVPAAPLKDAVEIDPKRKQTCYNIAGFTYMSVMLGFPIGMIAGLFWAFGKENRTISMSISLTGWGFCIIGVITAMSFPAYCKSVRISRETGFFEKYDFSFTYDYKTGDYCVRLTCRI